MSTIDNIGIISADIDDGGWQATGNIFGDADRLLWYQAVEKWFFLYRGGGWEATPRAAFSGHLLPETWQKTFQSSVAPYKAFTAQEFLKRGELQGIFFKEDASPANQHQITGMTYAHIIEHILGKTGEYGHWNGVDGVWEEGFAQLNLDKTNSVAPDNHEVKAGNFWMRLQEIAQIEFYVLYVDKTNTINYVPHPMFDATLPSVTMDLTSAHLLEPLRIISRNTEEVGQVRLQGTTPAGEPISGKYPTEPTAGPVQQQRGFKATANTKMNTVSERMYKFQNRDFSVQVELPGAMGLLFDLLDRVSITYTSSADGITWTAKKFWVHRIRVQLRDNFNAVSTLFLEAENP